MGIGWKSLLRVAALVMGSVWLFPVSCTTALIGGTPMVSKLDERLAHRGDELHTPFTVVALPGVSEGLPFRALRLGEGSNRSDIPLSFLMREPSGSIVTETSTVAFQILEASGGLQVVEVVETSLDGDRTVWSRYKTDGTSVEPIGSRMSYFGQMFTAFPFAFLTALALYFVGRGLRRVSGRPR